MCVTGGRAQQRGISDGGRWLGMAQLPSDVRIGEHKQGKGLRNEKQYDRAQ